MIPWLDVRFSFVVFSCLIVFQGSMRQMDTNRLIFLNVIPSGAFEKAPGVPPDKPEQKFASYG